MTDTDRTKLDAWLDLLAEQVADKLEARWRTREAKPEPPRTIQPIVVIPSPTPKPASTPVAESVKEITPENKIAETVGEPDQAVAKPAVETVPSPIAPAASHAAALMARLAVGVLLIVVLINVPLNTQGIALARSIPSSADLVFMNGLLVKEENSPDIWVYRDDKFHWITSLDAFDHYGYRWQDVHIVEPGFLNQFDKGNPIYVLLKCDASPHVYRLDAGQKRWIIDIPTFQAEGYIWQDVMFVPCEYLRNLPNGESIPPGHGTPPPPLP